MMDKIEIEFLFGERQLLNDRIAKTNEKIYKYISIIVTPFFLLVGYSIINFNSNWKYIILFLPHFCIFSIMIMGMLYMQHFIVGNYSRFIVDELNSKFKTSIFLLEKLEYEFYAKGFNLQKALILNSIIVIIVVNLLICPLILEVLNSLENAVLVKYFNIYQLKIGYWLILVFISLICLFSFYAQFRKKANKVIGM